jgi:hypothetical protein
VDNVSSYIDREGEPLAAADGRRHAYGSATHSPGIASGDVAVLVAWALAGTVTTLLRFRWTRAPRPRITQHKEIRIMEITPVIIAIVAVRVGLRLFRTARQSER